MRDLVDEHYPEAKRIRVVLDNLSAHSPAALYQRLAPAEARRILSRLETSAAGYQVPCAPGAIPGSTDRCGEWWVQAAISGPVEADLVAEPSCSAVAAPASSAGFSMSERSALRVAGRTSR